MKKDRNHCVFITAFALMTAAFSLTAWADPPSTAVLNGWCFPATECTGEPSEIRNGSYSTCEEMCELRDPVEIRGLPGILFNVTCTGDGMPQRSERVLFMAQKHAGSMESMLFIDKRSATALERCQ